MDKCKQWIALGGVAGIVYWLWGRSHSSYRHRFTDFTDALASPCNLRLSIYNVLFSVLGRRHEAFRQRVIELARLRAGERVLDAGCGTGLTIVRIAAQHPTCIVHGIDLSPKMIEIAQADAEKQGLAVDLRIGSATGLPYPDGSFDVVITNIMYHHLDLEEKRQAVAEIARVLEPGGRYVSAEFGARTPNLLQRRMAKGDYTLYPSHLLEAGFTICHEELSHLALGAHLYYRVAVKPEAAAESLEDLS
jgi:SAM-dependent methyltransferase